ncbi:S-protein homolog 4-like [Eucalyptus grandis]|uniref:S-protein homolog 4-like n=1 Tax=Eucalyptus grandis TaxID=71139 RepID=UPI000526919D|nr:S-protein homolog 4-like [Eucalyptus grandis]
MVPSARILLVLVAIMALHQVNAAGIFAGIFDVFRVYVQITNKLPGRVTLRVHCQSKDDDLGFHNIAPNKYWGFKFFPKIYGTLFFCSVKWPGHFHYFNAYDDSLIEHGLGRWTIKPEGPCVHSHLPDVLYTDCRKWNS